MQSRTIDQNKIIALCDTTLSTINAIPTDSRTLKEELHIAFARDVTAQIQTIITPDKNDDEIKSALIQFLKETWEKIKTTPLTYTSIPRAAITQLMIAVAQQLAPDDIARQLSYLMPGLNTDYDDIVAFLDEKNIPLQSIIDTHVLTHDGNYLSHILFMIKGLEKEDAKTILQDECSQFYNVFSGNISSDKSVYKVSGKDYDKLIHHSEPMHALYEAHQSYMTVAQDGNHLLAHLQRLIPLLYYYSRDGIGKEDLAGLGGAKAIALFFDFYRQLPKAVRETIPQAVKTEIKMLGKGIDYQDKIDNFKRTAEEYTNILWTCLATRRAELLKSMTGHHAALANITADATAKGELLAKKEVEISKQVAAIKASIKENTYTGNDHFYITLELLQTYNITVPLPASYAELLFLLKHASLEDLKHIFNETHAQHVLNNNIITLEELVLLQTEMPITHVGYFLQQCGEALVSFLKDNKVELGVLLMSLDAEQIGILLHDIKPIIKTTADLIAVLKNLTETQRAVALEAVKDKFTGPNGLLKTIDNLCRVLQSLSEAQCRVVLEAIKAKLTGADGLIKTAYNFRQVLQHLPQAQATEVFQAFKDKLTRPDGIIKTAEDFSCVLQYLPQVQATEIFQAFKDKLTRPDGIIKTAEDFFLVLQHLNEAERTEVFKAVKAKLTGTDGLIKTAEDFFLVLKYLNEAERTEVFKAVKAKLTGADGLIKTAEDLSDVLQSLSEAQCRVVLEAIKAKLTGADGLIETAKDFTEVFQYLSEAQRTVVFDAIKDKLTGADGIIKTAFDLQLIEDYLTTEQLATKRAALAAYLASQARSQGVGFFANASQGGDGANGSVSLEETLPRNNNVN